MSGNYRFEMEQEDIVRSLVSTVESFIQDRLIDKEQRAQHKEQCAERLAAEDGSSDKDAEVRYSDQAVLANLDWGIEALEEAINTSNMETKMARLDYAEKMLQVCAMLNSGQRTAGVPNFYLSAWAHLNLSYLWQLRNDVRNAVLHMLEMFIVDPFFSRVDFAPELWKSLFLPHMSSVVGWYSEERHRIVMDVVPDSGDLSLTADFDHYFNESFVYSVRPDQAEKMQNLEQLYAQSLDENTKLYARYFKDCMNYDFATAKKGIPMLPIAEAPMTPLREVSRSIPDYVKFGPILPKSAGFSPVLKAKERAKEASRLNATSSSSENQQITIWEPQGIPEENEESFESEPEAYTKKTSYDSVGICKEKEPRLKRQLTKTSSQKQSPTSSSPVDSPRTPPAKLSSPKGNNSKKEGPSIIRLFSTRIRDTSNIPSLTGSPHSLKEPSISSVESDGEGTVCFRPELTLNSPEPQLWSPTDFGLDMQDQHETRRKNPSHRRRASQLSEKCYLNESDEGSQSCISFTLSEKSTPKSRPPKDFVCPITSQIFNDPVTLETGQTYERKAIQEWMNRGNTTCPITRQPLSATCLPKTNYVLKRLIASWKEQHPDLAQEFSYSETPRSYLSTPSSKEMSSEFTPSHALNTPNHRVGDGNIEHRPQRFARAAVLTQPPSAAVGAIINSLKPYVSCLCTSDNLQECEAAVLKIARAWRDSHVESGLYSYLSSPTIVNGFMEVLSASSDREVLRTAVYILSELIYADDSVSEVFTSVDTDFECLAALLKNGLAEAAVLIYLLRPSFSQLSAHNFIPSLIQMISNKNEDCNNLQLAIAPKDAAIALIEKIIMGGDESDRSSNTKNIISASGIPALLKCLERETGREFVVSVLLCCIRTDKSCRNLIANRIELSPVLELIHAENDRTRDTCIEFLYELVLQSRRTLCNQILQIIKDEGAFSTMHTLLVCLQMAAAERKPIIAALLLQLDLLVDPKKMSIYREESIDALIEALHRKDFPASQIRALEALSCISGYLTTSGKSFLEAWLLKSAGFHQPYNAMVKEEKRKNSETGFTDKMGEEEKAMISWEKRAVFVLCNHEKGVIFKALEECLKSNSMEVARSCLVTATWLIHMLYRLPDTGIRDVARKSLLDQFIHTLQSTKNLEEKILATLALRGFISDFGALNEMGVYAKCMCKTLMKLKKHSTVVGDMMKALMTLPCIDAVSMAELWSYTEGPELDTSMNGEVLSVLHIRGRLISSHSDGTIKVWDTGKRTPRLIYEAREHSKAVTCLHVSSSCDKLYSGSLDRTIRVWAIKQGEIHCIQVHDMKEAVLGLTANSNVACFSTQGTGVKVYNWSGSPKHVNFNKYVKCLALAGDKLYCGCTGYSIQEVDLSTYTTTTFYTGTKKLLGKQTILSLEIHKDVLFAGGSSVDGIAGKIFSLPSKAVIGLFPSNSDIQQVMVNTDFIFLAMKCGTIEVWQKERATKIASLKLKSSGNTRITSLTPDKDGEMIFVGCSDGRIQTWSLE